MTSFRSCMWVLRGRGGEEEVEVRAEEEGRKQVKYHLFGLAHNNSVIPHSRKIWRELYLAIWPPTTEFKYWRNLNLAICNCEAKFHYVILACGN